jgi:hypothetical protein
MTASAAPELNLADLDAILRRTDPAVLLVPPRILRRVIKQDRRIEGLGLQVPHRKSYLIARDSLLRITDRDDLGLPPNRELPAELVLLPQPALNRLARGRDRTLTEYWRLLFHARIHQALAARRAEGRLTDAMVRDRIRRIGMTEIDEVRAVLRQERFLLPPARGGSEVFAEYEEFVALYLELRLFAPQLLPAYFTAIVHPAAVDAILAEDVDAAALFGTTRPEGAPDPGPPPPERHRPPEPTPSLTDHPPGAGTRRVLTRQADRFEARGNVVRAALCRVRAAVSTQGSKAGVLRAEARQDLEMLAARLQQALGLDDDEAAEWLDALAPLLEPAAPGYWPVEARLLYDLQKVCIDYERPLYAADLVEWVVSWGKKRIIRLLPHHKVLMAVKHLRIAVRRLPAIRIADEARDRLSHHLHEALHRVECRLRNELRPEIVRVLDQVDLVPENVAEGVSRDKVVEELLDRVAERDFLTIGDLRDALARNRLKLPDVAGPVSFFTGDKLIRANRGLAESMDGIYRRGEIYLRWLQRLSSAAFGTSVGRFLTRYLILPFGGSFMVLKVWEEIHHLFMKHVLPLFRGPSVAEITDRAVQVTRVWSSVAQAQAHQSVGGGPIPGLQGVVESLWVPPAKHELGVPLYPWLILGVFLFGVLHAGFFRNLAWEGLKWVWRGVRGVLYDLPMAIINSAPVQHLLASRPVQLFFQFLIKPLPWAAGAWLALYLAGVPPEWALGVAGGVFLVASTILHSRLGLYLEEVTIDGAVRWWHLMRADVLPGIFRWVVYFYRRLMEDLEKLLYTVDEALRFRSGDSRVSLVIKPVLGLVWFVITYLFRIIINLFVEPTFNPIKHFPTVTVTAKLIFPMMLQIVAAFKAPLEPIVGKAMATTLAGVGFFLLPGFGGFLVWELKENWRLYRANMPPTLRPVIVGHHGETVLRLMHPGIHSGTLPKLYAKLRRLKGRSARRQLEAIGGVEEAMRHFVERDLLAVLATSKTWASAPPLAIGELHAGANRIRIELQTRDVPSEPIYVELEEHSGWLLAGIAGPPGGGTGWLGSLSEEQRRAFRDALAGFYKLSGVSLVREQIEAQLPDGAVWDVCGDAVTVWPGPGVEEGASYPLGPGPVVQPQPTTLPPVVIRKIVYQETPIEWSAWVRTWQHDHDGAAHEALVPEDLRLLPGEKPIAAAIGQLAGGVG